MPDPCPAELRSILAASDLSADSEVGLQAAAATAAAAGAELHVYHCVTKPVFPYWEGIVDPASSERWIQNAQLDLEWQVRRVLGEEVAPASVAVTIGEPAREITQRAAAVSADLIAVGPHRPRVMFDDLLGTTADRLIRSAAVPCLIANRPLEPPLRRVLVPTDFSEPARHAFEVAIDWLGRALRRPDADGGPVVVEILFVSAFASPSYRPLAVEPRLAELAEAARRRLPEESRVKLLPRILSAPLPVDGVRHAAERSETQLLVLGTHGYGTLGRALIGSVASAVARTVPFPILLVPPPTG